MNTPITDAAFRSMNDETWSATAREMRNTAREMRNTARRLELDRAELMDFLAKLETMANDDEYGSSDFRKVCRYDIPKALAAARANFSNA